MDANCILQLANAPDMNKNQKALYRQRIFEHIQCFLEIPNLLFPCFKRHNQAGGDEFCVNLLKCLRGTCLNLAEEIKGNRVLAMQCFSHLRDFCREECNKLVNTADLKTVICSIRERSREESLRFFNQQAGAARAAPAAVPKKAAAKARIAEEEPDVWNQPPKQEPCAWEQELRPEQVPKVRQVSAAQQWLGHAPQADQLPKPGQAPQLPKHGQAPPLNEGQAPCNQGQVIFKNPPGYPQAGVAGPAQPGPPGQAKAAANFVPPPPKKPGAAPELPPKVALPLKPPPAGFKGFGQKGRIEDSAQVRLGCTHDLYSLVLFIFVYLLIVCLFMNCGFIS